MGIAHVFLFVDAADLAEDFVDAWFQWWEVFTGLLLTMLIHTKALDKRYDLVIDIELREQDLFRRRTSLDSLGDLLVHRFHATGRRSDARLAIS